MKYEKKGDQLVRKGKLRQALEKYEISEKLDPNRAEIYQKLIDTLNQMDVSWTEADFNRSMNWTLREQELKNPELKQIYEKFSAEYQAVQKLIRQLMLAPPGDAENQLIQAIIEYGEKAHLPLLDFLLSLKKMGGSPLEPEAKENSSDFSLSDPTEEL